MRVEGRRGEWTKGRKGEKMEKARADLQSVQPDARIANPREQKNIVQVNKMSFYLDQNLEQKNKSVFL